MTKTNPLVDVTAFLSAIADAGLSANFSVYPRDPSPDEEADLLPRYSVLELAEGELAMGKEADMADIIIIGGRLFKNRHGRLSHYVGSATVHLGTKFDIGQRVGFLRKRGGAIIGARGEILTVTQYRDREPVYCVTLDKATVGLFGGVREAYADEGELAAIDVDAGAEDPEAGRQAEPAGERVADPDVATVHLAQGIFSGMLRGDELRAIIENSPRLAQALCRGLERSDPRTFGENMTYGDLRNHGARGRLTAKVVVAALVAELTKPGEPVVDLAEPAAIDPALADRGELQLLGAELKRIDALLQVVGSPLPLGVPSLDDIGLRRAGEIARDLCDQLCVTRTAVLHRIMAIDFEAWQP